MIRSFANKSTLSVGKIETEFLSDEYIRPILKRLHTRQGRFKVAILVGSPDGSKRDDSLIRHVERMKSGGVSERDICIFERERKTYLRLKHAILRLRLKVKLYNECLLHGVERLSSQGETFSYIEFDGVCQFGTFEFDLYRLIKRLGVPILVSQGSSRGQIDAVKTLGRKIKAPRRKINGYNCFQLIPLAKRLISRKLKGYQNEIFTYQGVSNMYMQISVQNEMVA